MGERADAEQLARRIWPAAHVARRHSPTSYTALPNAHDPRLLLPSDRRLALAALRARTTPATRRERLRNDALAAVVAICGVRPLRGAVIETAGLEPSVLDRLSDIVGVSVNAGVHLGPPRANRKPVLALLDPGGNVVAYAKLGVNDLTARLVRNEAAALARLAVRGATDFVPPQLIHAESWHGVELLVMSPLKLPARPRDPSNAALVRTTREVASTGRSADVSASTLLGRVEDDNRSLGARGSSALAEFVDRVRASGGEVVLSTGAWHGDFAPGNVVTSSDGRLVVMDWERYETQAAPLGADLAHYVVRRHAHALGHGMAAAIAQWAPAAPSLLRPLGVDRLRSHLVFSIYLCRLALRYLADDNFGASDPERTLQEWFRLAGTAHPA